MTRIIDKDISFAAECIRAGGLVSVPTETVYGLAANGLDADAVEKIYQVKGRPAIKPLSLMVHDAAAFEQYCVDVPEMAYALAEHFWPGPLTIVLKAKDIVPDIVRAGGSTVGLRCPDHEKTLELLKKCSVPLAAPSANPSDLPSAKNAKQVLEYFDGKIDAVIDGGQCGIGLESTIIDMSVKPFRILRRGALDEKLIVDAMVEYTTIVGITGPTGCGKTTALNVLSDFAALVLDCDEVYHQLLEKDEALIAEIDARFPGTVENGKLNRKALGAIVFNDSVALSDLNRISHAHISRETDRRIRDFALSGGTVVGLDAIELIGSGMAERCDVLIAVLSDKEKRAERIMSRDGLSYEAALLRINAQKTDDYFIDNCDFVLYNNGTEDEFEDSVLNLLTEVL